MENKDKDKNIKICSFCGCTEEQNKIISGDEVSICLSCVETANYLFSIEENMKILNDISDDKSDKSDSSTEENLEKNYKPKDYLKILDNYVVGQDKAKKTLSTGIYNHMLRVNNPGLKIDKSNILFIGPTGSGKTYLAEVISNNLDIPLAIVNTTSLTAAGYVGEDVSSVLERLWRNAGEDVSKAEKGIIFLDEIDKNATSGGGTNNKDVSGKAVQQELLKILEGDIVKIYPEGTSRNKKDGESIEINTKDILFIAGGAFVGLKSKDGVQMSALGKVVDNIDEVPDTESLIQFGMIPEFIGRFPMIVELENIDKKAMIKIMTEPKDNIISQYENLFKLSKVNLTFDNKAIDEIAKISLNKKTGARGLRNVMENIMGEYMFNIDEFEGKEINITFSYNKFKQKEISTTQIEV